VKFPAFLIEVGRSDVGPRPGKEIQMVEKKAAAKSVKRTATHAKNAGVVAKGKAKSATGKMVGDRKLQASGKVDQMKGRAKQAGQRVKESFDK
jgi:uncharacterized protein YjbJ (UPF0337 family)